MVNWNIFRRRRERLLENIRRNHPEVRSGMILFCSGFENSRCRFRPDSSAYYLTGVTEPGITVTIDLVGKMVAYLPRYKVKRTAWCFGHSKDDIWWNAAGFTDIRFMGECVTGHSLKMPLQANQILSLVNVVTQVCHSNGTVFTIGDFSGCDSQQYLLLSTIERYVNSFRNHICDVSSILGSLRRLKDEIELSAICHAIDITVKGQKAAAKAIKAGLSELHIRAALEGSFMMNGSFDTAFPSIVASGSNATVLHHSCGGKVLQDGELVVVDVGSEFDYYASDLTRTYPVSGEFSPRQAELYNYVLDVQLAIECAARPGMFLKRSAEPDKSLQYVAEEAFRRFKLDKFFVHGIGHFVGLDVHDAGDLKKPLALGDVFTIEPGLYLPSEGIGIRIEDDYLMTEDGAERLSTQLPRELCEIEEMVSS